ncbi:hypothetical protein [Cupriavidus metallidurans]|uniref:hypothetical protein n=1 Tax=Cupriavidus metallidurans TaxID=119219 RepID=UPI000CE04B39|nr:hypothetical protein [Cupriavidus metallidurans]AVA33803.1 hypothetical protein C3Z06_09325 [Cupriavidus metallidurans]
MSVYREFNNGWCLAMNDEVGTRVIPRSVFRFGVKFMNENCVEIHQPGATSAVRRVELFPGDTEDSVRAFLLSVGFEERPRAGPGEPTLESQA